LIAATLLSSLTACAPQETKTPTEQETLAILPPGGPLRNLDALPARQTIFQVEIFVLSVPYGTLSGNDEFWKQIDEHSLDPGTYDLLYRSGVRVGQAPWAERRMLDKYMEGIVPIEKIGVNGSEYKNLQIKMKSKVIDQDIFYVDKTNQTVGRTYLDSDNFINISFEPALRKPGTLRLTCCPMVRSLTKYHRATALNNDFIVEAVTDESIFDLGFKVDLPSDSFLIATPSPESSKWSSVGGAFFVKDGNTERLEQVLIVKSTPFMIEIGKPVQ
jgi:hypothetical protein